MSALPDWVDDDALAEAEREALELVHAEFVDTGWATWVDPDPEQLALGDE